MLYRLRAVVQPAPISGLILVCFLPLEIGPSLYGWICEKTRPGRVFAEACLVAIKHQGLAGRKQFERLSRFDNHGENPPTGWTALPGGQISGVAVDVSDRLWVADFDKKLVEDPLPLI